MKDIKIVLKTKPNTNGNYTTLTIDCVKKTYKKDYNTMASVDDVVIKTNLKTIKDTIIQLRFNDFIDV